MRSVHVQSVAIAASYDDRRQSDIALSFPTIESLLHGFGDLFLTFPPSSTLAFIVFLLRLSTSVVCVASYRPHDLLWYSFMTLDEPLHTNWCRASDVVGLDLNPIPNLHLAVIH